MSSKGSSAVLWWVGWIILTIISFFISCYFWTGVIARHVGPMNKAGVPAIWVAAVFGTWLIFLIPLIIVMYQKVDKAYEDARIAREKSALEKARISSAFRSIHMEDSQRLLNQSLQSKLKKIPNAIRQGQLVTAILRDGRKIENVFILNKKEMLGIYGVGTPGFTAQDIVDLEGADLDRLPRFQIQEWLRLDG